MKKTQTLIDTCEALTRHVCVLIDSNASPETVAKARADRDAVKSEIQSRPDGRTYDTGLFS